MESTLKIDKTYISGTSNAKIGTVIVDKNTFVCK